MPNYLHLIYNQLFHDGGRYHIETRANQWTGFYMITASIMNGFSHSSKPINKTTDIITQWLYETNVYDSVATFDYRCNNSKAVVDRFRKNFAIFTGERLCWSHFLTKLLAKKMLLKIS